MKYEYKTATGIIVVEITEDWCEVLKELDRKEQNNEHKETRRHSTLNNGIDDYEWLAVDDEDLADLFREPTIKEKLNSALEQLNEQQKALINALFYKNKTQVEYAAELGVTQGAISQRLAVIIKKLKKLLEKS